MILGHWIKDIVTIVSRIERIEGDILLQIDEMEKKKGIKCEFVMAKD